jgi:FixJ family two-component response regulator
VSAIVDEHLSEPPVISIIDDDPIARESTGDLVRSLGYEALTFESAAHFLGSACLEKTSCLIADLQMPGIGGLDLQSHLLTLGYRKPIIFITAFPEENSRIRALNAGAAGFLRKPYDETSLIRCLNAALGDTSDGMRS